MKLLTMLHSGNGACGKQHTQWRLNRLDFPCAYEGYGDCIATRH
jgi:hypothetical protein